MNLETGISFVTMATLLWLQIHMIRCSARHRELLDEIRKLKDKNK